jgi:signal peptidase II
MTQMSESRWDHYKTLLSIAGIVVFLDQATKVFIRSRLKLGETWIPLPTLIPKFQIINWQNEGSAFGITLGGRLLYTVLSVLAIGAIVYYYPRVSRQDWSLKLCLALLAGGVAGNLIDRLYQGYVTDFLSFDLQYVFNLADVSNLLGLIILLIGLLTEKKQKRATMTQQPPERNNPEH